MRRAWAVLGLLAIPPAADADEVVLRGGGVIRGEVVADGRDAVVIEVGPGRVTVPRSRIERVVAGTSDLATFRQRAAGLAPEDTRGWLGLARWAEDRDLLTQAREAFARAAAADPGSAEAQQGLGRVLVDGRWLGEDAANRARGLVEFEGRWVTPAEQAALLEAQAAAVEARRAEAESAARIREAEARTRVAEAEARRLEAEAAAASGGVPYGPVHGPIGGGILVPVVVVDDEKHHGGRRGGHRAGRPPQGQPPPPARRPPARDRGGDSQRAHREGSRRVSSDHR
jgi:hypothetical protein